MPIERCEGLLTTPQNNIPTLLYSPWKKILIQRQRQKGPFVFYLRNGREGYLYLRLRTFDFWMTWKELQIFPKVNRVMWGCYCLPAYCDLKFCYFRTYVLDQNITYPVLHIPLVNINLSFGLRWIFHNVLGEYQTDVTFWCFVSFSEFPLQKAY